MVASFSGERLREENGQSMSDKYPVIVWGTGVVGKLVIRELLDHPVFELAAVLVHDPAKDGVDVGTLVGSHPTGLAATTDIDAALGTEGTVAYFGPTAQYALENIDNMSRALRSGHNIVSTAMTPWVYPQVCPPEMLTDIRHACEEGQTSCFTTGIDPGFANDLFPMTLLGVGGRVDSVLVQELLDYQYYNGDFSTPMGLGAPMDQPAVLEIPEVLILAWGHTIPMIADAVGVKLDKIDTVYEKWATPTEISYGAAPNTGTIPAGHCASVRFEIRGWVGGEPKIVIEHVNRITNDTAPQWPRAQSVDNDAYRIEIKGSPNITQETVFRDERSGDGAIGGCLATGMRAINAIPAVIDAKPGFLTPLDLPLIPGRGTIRI
ncbi:NAD(P)H-dependent amine dehydrogenase family protein [Mycobacteroides abscessus]|uniref:NAD(P)H-dependent amine dehydrogenase family protein n=1 Tax=Mycobacteroides abscessus TaxID=36809 RepID=UPI0009D484C3|nr:dihydrodipicolinate reductase [Mycobacteroides abscessus]SKJ12173.1 putative dihydropicolinate reductase [Mycobacteroides abscessus subsp. massiliense]SKJ43800.1 putative dihydropicolinate reductase [Mycobacteroides abscessus subsp. massiliense]SKK25847.1 putative dihydropicolinate reductase [Mycobacteroides abscessus subsp. massiliense]SKR56915.1 putative dihydropicolinate reductase [Mycobacteroides abscessus subsp. massiliense]SKS77884.1 putative dihydropicolinate reductase [Mycobacteroid